MSAEVTPADRIIDGHFLLWDISFILDFVQTDIYYLINQFCKTKLNKLTLKSIPRRGDPRQLSGSLHDFHRGVGKYLWN